MSRLVWFQKAILLVGLIVSFNTLASDLGVIGVSYPIIERDLLDLIEETLEAKKASGEIDEINQSMLSDTRDYVNRPDGFSLPRATEYRATEINPVYVLDQDITDADGKVLFVAGTTVNPLEFKPLTKILCFIDGDDEAQVVWLQKYCADNSRNKLILVKGDYVDIGTKLGVRLYFDQNAFLVNRFNIQALPAVIRQGGSLLFLEEFPVE